MGADHLATDGVLIKSWQAGNEKAYRQLFNKYYHPLYHYAYQFVSDRFTSEEIVMDVLLSIWKKKGSLDSSLSVSAFMYKSVRNRVIDYTRKQRIRPVPIDEAADARSSSRALEADHRVATKEMDNLYRNCLEKLSPRKRTIFLMSREEGHSYMAIATKLRLSKNTVENHMVAALRHFKNHLSEALSFRN